MLKLPVETEINKHLPKKMIYGKFGMSAADKAKFDQDIGKLYISNELSPATLHVQDGKEVHSFFVVLVELKGKKYSERNIVTISKLIPQNMVFVLKFGHELQLAVVKSRLLHTEWENEEKPVLSMDGLTMDSVWQNVIIQIGDIELDGRYTLEQQITVDEKRSQAEQHIAQLEKLARSEKQPRKKLELVEKIQALQKDLENKE